MKRARRRIRRLLSGLTLGLVIEFLVLPQVAGARKALHLLGRVDPLLLVAALLLEMGALLAYAALTMSVLPRDARPPLSTILRIDLSTLAVSHVVPGGLAAGAGVALDLLTDAGLSAADAGFALATQGLGSAAVLNLLLWLALVVSIPARGFDPRYGIAALLGAALLGGFLATVLVLTRGEEGAARWLPKVAGRLPFVDPESVQQAVHRVAARLRELASDRALLARAGGWACANWLLDAAALWVCIAAFGYRMGPVGLMVSYGLANVVAVVPVTPGGLGVMEAVLTGTLVGFGAPRAEAIVAVVTWRVVNFWLPIPVGGLSYLSLRLGPGALGAGGIAELRRLAERARQEAERPQRWAARHGLRLRTSR